MNKDESKTRPSVVQPKRSGFQLLLDYVTVPVFFGVREAWHFTV